MNVSSISKKSKDGNADDSHIPSFGTRIEVKRAGVPPPVFLATPLPRGTLTHTPINAETGVPLTLLKDEFVILCLT